MKRRSLLVPRFLLAVNVLAGSSLLVTTKLKVAVLTDQLDCSFHFHGTK